MLVLLCADAQGLNALALVYPLDVDYLLRDGVVSDGVIGNFGVDEDGCDFGFVIV